MKSQIKSRWDDTVKFECELGAEFETQPFGVQLGAAVKTAVSTDADLTGTNLRGTNLTRAYLRGTNLTGTNLTGADLTRADLTDADLTGADLTRANFTRADLTGTNLTRAYLRGTNLTDADLTDADLTGADLRGADLTGVKWPHFQIAEGALIGWKKLAGGMIAKLEIPADARRTASVVGRKCRAEFVKTLAIYQGETEVAEGIGAHDGKTKYAVGEITRPDSYDDNCAVECTHGIHFFQTRAEAEQY